MKQKPHTLLHDFSPVTKADWAALAEQTLQGREISSLRKQLMEGVGLEPLYLEQPIPLAQTYPPDVSPYVRGHGTYARRQAGWDIRQMYDTGSLASVAASLLDDRDRGVCSFWLQPAYATDSDLFGDKTGLPLFFEQDWHQLFSSIDLTQTPIAVATGAYLLPVLAQIASVTQQRGVATTDLMGAVYADPLATWARHGQLPDMLPKLMQDVASGISWAKTQAPYLQTLCCSGLPYHDAGAHHVQELAYIMATALAYFRRLEACGLDIDTIAASTFVQTGIDSHQFLAIAKLRALRLLWAKVVKACGGSPSSQHVLIHACTSRVSTAKRDPWTNVLRNTAEGFAAAVGGADAITITPFDRCLGVPEAVALRLASHTQLILAKEAHLSHVIDPAGGSWYVEYLTDTLARLAWAELQRIETQGGMEVALSSGFVATSIEHTVARKSKDIARRKTPIVGVSEYVNLQESPLHRSPAHAPESPSLVPGKRLAGWEKKLRQTTPADRMKTLQEASREGLSVFDLFSLLHPQPEMVSGSPLFPFRGAMAWEVLRDRSDQYAGEHGHFPQIFLANLGPASAHKTRSDFTQRFLSAAGFEAITNDGFTSHEAAAQAFVQSQAQAVVICGTDTAYQDSVEPLAVLLQAHSPKFIALAGRPGANETAWRNAGVTHFLYLGCDALSLLQEWQRWMGVIS